RLLVLTHDQLAATRGSSPVDPAATIARPVIAQAEELAFVRAAMLQTLLTDGRLLAVEPLPLRSQAAQPRKNDHRVRRRNRNCSLHQAQREARADAERTQAISPALRQSADVRTDRRL